MKWLLVAWIALFSLQGHTEEPVSYPKVANQIQPSIMLYYSPTCPHSRKVLDYLDAINKTVPMKNVYSSPEVKEELIARGGKAQVPCLVVDNQPIYNADHIMQWLSEHKELLEGN